MGRARGSDPYRQRVTFAERLPWRVAMERALYGPGGFFVSGAGPAAHFRTSVHASPVFSSCLLRLLDSVDRALGHPPRLDVVDVGAGRGELLRALLVGVSGTPAQRSPAAPVPLADRVRLIAVERAPRPEDLPAEIDWLDEIPEGITGLLVATEWLDNVPLDLAGHTGGGWRHLLVDPTTGTESTGPPLPPEDADWLTRWWPTPTSRSPIREFASAGGPEPDMKLLINEVAARAEIGRTRDEAWAEAVRRVERGLAVTVDYGHLRKERPVDGTLTGYRDGRQVPPVPDGSADVTAHVAMDSVASAGERVARCAYTLISQREALRALGADGGRPPLSLASQDPAGYVRALAAASAVAELTDPAGLGGHWWLLQPVGVTIDPVMAR
ncbi:SAM-dependent methyltransferase, MidA family [Micromonospora narathiwatensis]|uniref:SAM-dependent methyltransferase, MidA family n=2 Tax=Micromonospora narathiwatensis TaxID=299146 RepID=A0A1A9A8Q3_9ACTN|nr:SAM-dependent methyltransferase, MidA family [Micromonospora narathiwatensis]